MYKKTKFPDKKKVKRKHLCHECVGEFMPKDLYGIDQNGTHWVYVCLECLKLLEPKKWKKIKKENDEYKVAKKSVK